MSTLEDVQTTLLGLLKGEHSSLSITFNDHANCRLTVEQAIEQGDLDPDDWISPDEMAKSIETNAVWCLRWYPDTPIGFCTALASTLPALIASFADERSTSAAEG